MRREAEARAPWHAPVPPRGQAATVQGEVIGASERLRDEARRNARANCDEGHAMLAEYVRDTLLGPERFDEPAVREIERDVVRICAFEYPKTCDGPCDRLADRAVAWARARPDPMPHAHNAASQR